MENKIILEPKGNVFTDQYFCSITEYLDEQAKIGDYSETDGDEERDEFYKSLFRHYVLWDNIFAKDNIFAIRVPGGTVGCVWYDENNKITKIHIDTNYVVRTYPDNINEMMIEKFVGNIIEIKEN